MKNSKPLRVISWIGMLGVLAFEPAAEANLVTNGNFGSLSTPLAANRICTTNPAVYPAVDPGAYPACSATGWTGNYQIGNGAAIGVFGVSFGIPQPDPSGSDALILQAEYNLAPTATELINIPTAGSYTLSFYVANRSSPAANAGPQTVSVLLNNALISGGTFDHLPDAWTLETLTFKAGAGVQSLTLEGLDETSGKAAANVAAFVNDVSLVSAGVPVAAPEPSTSVLFGIGTVLVAGLLRRGEQRRVRETVL